jgi:hypothetical protein
LAHGQVWLDVAAAVLPFGQLDVPVGEWLVRDLAEQVADDVEPGLLPGRHQLQEPLATLLQASTTVVGVFLPVKAVILYLAVSGALRRRVALAHTHPYTAPHSVTMKRR